LGLDAEDRLLDLLLPPRPVAPDEDPARAREEGQRTRERMREQLREGRLDERVVEIEVTQKGFPSLEIIAGSSVEEVEFNLKDMLPGFFQKGSKKKRVPVREAVGALRQEEEQKLVDMDSVARIAIDRVQQSGIIFVDEIDKVAGREGGHGPEVSREGVQRDILPIVEGTTVNTKHGMVRTDHVLFIAAGAFHVSKPSDLIPELQGRFPIRVELEALGQDEFVRILTEPRSALVKQYMALMATEGVTLTFTGEAIERIAEFATTVNERTENIGARRLHTVMERLLDEVSFDAPADGGDADARPFQTGRGGRPADPSASPPPLRRPPRQGSIPRHGWRSRSRPRRPHPQVTPSGSRGPSRVTRPRRPGRPCRPRRPSRPPPLRFARSRSVSIVARGVTRGGRPGPPSARVELPIVDVPPPPTGLDATVTEEAVILEWAPPDTAPDVLFNVYEGTDDLQPVTPKPIAAPTFEQPVRFGEERCYRVRSARVAGAVVVEGPSSEPFCLTPEDIFPPAAPTGLAAVSTAGQVSLIWDANTEADLAGYLVLRGETPDGSLQPLTPSPDRRDVVP
jgi:hypothetical protein